MSGRSCEDCCQVLLVRMRRCNRFRLHPSWMNHRASQSNSSGCVGVPPRVPKSDGVLTNPTPKCPCHTRFTMTRAVRGCSGCNIHDARSSRPEFDSMGGAGTKWSLTCRKPRGISSPISWVWSPRACSLTERISDSSRTEMVLGARGASLASSCANFSLAAAQALRSPSSASIRSWSVGTKGPSTSQRCCASS